MEKLSESKFGARAHTCSTLGLFASFRELEKRINWCHISVLPFISKGAVQIAISSMGSTNSSLIIKGTETRALFLTIISFYIMQCAAIKDVDNITLLGQPGIVGIWRWNDRAKYYPLSDFRNESARNYYDVWPEDNDDFSFKFPCEDRKSRLMLKNFTYSMNGGLVQSLQYYDLGIVYQYRPYWRRPNTTCFGCTMTKLVGFPEIYCERGDLSLLYYVRAKKTVFEGVLFGMGMVAIQQIAFAIIGLLIPVYQLNRTQSLTCMDVTRIAAKYLKDLNWGETSVEWLHLLALAAAGYLMVEGYGHSHPSNWRAAAMNTLAYYYRVQTACAFVSSFLRQCANSMKVIVGGGDLTTSSHDKHREMLIGQVVVCVVMVEYLYLTDVDYLNFMIQVVFAVVTVAVTYSMSIVISVGCKSLWYILKPLWKKMKIRVAKMMADDPAAGSPQPQPGSSTTSPATSPAHP